MDVDSGFDGGFNGGFNIWFVGGYSRFNSGFDGGFNGQFDGGFDGRFHLSVLGYWPLQSVRQLRQEAFTAISQEGLMGSLLN